MSPLALQIKFSGYWARGGAHESVLTAAGGSILIDGAQALSVDARKCLKRVIETCEVLRIADGSVHRPDVAVMRGACSESMAPGLPAGLRQSGRPHAAEATKPCFIAAPHSSSHLGEAGAALRGYPTTQSRFQPGDIDPSRPRL